MKRRRIIVTTGTSILGGRPPDSPDNLAHLVRERIETLQKEHSEPDKVLRVLSAETNSLLRMGIRQDDEILLLCTDTPVGEACGRELQKIIHARFGIEASVNTIKGLQVDEARTFRTVGIQNLFAFLDKNLGEIRFTRDQEIVLNVTGGFKSVVPYVTLYGILRRFPVVYLFERSEELIVLPPVPLYYDQALVNRAQKALVALRKEGVMAREAINRLIRDFTPGEESLFEAFFESDEAGEATLSAFGQLLLDDTDLDTLPVELSTEAEATYNAATGSRKEILETLLHHLSQPGWLDTHFHRFSGTDLTVVKPGRTPARAAGYRKGKTFRVCLLFPDHDQYERDLPGRNRAEFEEAAFSDWVAPAGAPDAPSEFEDILKNQDAALETLQQEYDELERTCLESEEKHAAELRQLREQADNNHAALQSANQSDHDLRERLGSCTLIERIRYLIKPHAFLDHHLPKESK